VTDGVPRLAPLPREQWDENVRAALAGAYSEKAAARYFGDDAVPMPNVLATLMHHPALAGPFLSYNNVLLFAPALNPRQRELLVLRVAFRTRSLYEWVQHVRMAASVDITAEEIAAIAKPVDAHAWSALDADLLRATDQLVDNYQVDDDTWRRLAEQLDARQLVEVVFVVGTYTGLAMAFRSFGLQLDPELHDLAATAPAEFQE
jgi:4-carboxymuconolactone decarboxylase